MGVTIPCPQCGAPIEVHQVRCACGHFVTWDDQDALERRFTASNQGYSEAKEVVVRALAAALVAGGFQLMLGVAHYASAYVAYQEHGDAVAMLFAILELLGGGALVYAWFAGKRAPLDALAGVSIVWLAMLALPFWLAPARSLVAFASPTGVVVTLARVGVLFLLIRGLLAARRKRTLFDPPPVRR